MEPFLNIEHNYTSFYERVKYWILLFIGVISISGIFCFFSGGKNPLLFIITFSIVFGIFITIKIYRNKLYIFDFSSDSQSVKILYLNGLKESSLETTLQNTNVKFRNTSSKSGFDCEIILNVGKLKFIITKDFDWNFEDMKQLFQYIKFHKKEKISEKETAIMESIDNYLKKYPF